MRQKGKRNVLLIGSSGYVGSALHKGLAANPHVRLGTVDIRASPTGNGPDFLCSHMELAAKSLAQYDTVLFFAGCSSVAAAEADPLLASQQNAHEVLDLARRLSSQQRLIYASSASVYSQPFSRVGEAPCDISSEDSAPARPANAYDASKLACDLLMPLTGSRATGLRMGTVSGHSAALRPELVFNAMVSSGMAGEPISLRNRSAWRAILHVSDLTQIVLSLVACEEELPPILNVGSMNLRIGELANRLAGHFGVTVRELPDSPTYSFALDTSLSRRYAACGDLSLEEYADQFVCSFARNDDV